MRHVVLAILMFSSPVIAESLMLDEFDQIKLGELLSRLPDGVAHKTSTAYPGELPGTETTITFPTEPMGFQITCRRRFFNGSPYPSFTFCAVGMESNHPNRDQSHDEVRYHLTEPAQVGGVFSAIPYGIPLKEFYSWGRDAGVNYEGQAVDVFRYRFECTESSCLIRFSGKAVVAE